MSNSAELKTEIHKMASLLPKPILDLLGDFPWAERAFEVRSEPTEKKIHVSFYSDGFNLSGKETIEKILKAALHHTKQEVVVHFTRKNKPETKAQSRPTPRSEPKPSQAQSPQVPTPRSIPGVKHIIAVASGKGGVGKSTVSVNLATALHQQGYKVGILDTDIYGPSVPTMLNVHDHPQVDENQKMIPIDAQGMKIMSFGFFAPEDTAVIWRGPMIMKALQQFFWDVNWGDLDFLVLDLPPGTGDVQLTLVQNLPISGAVVVTTPQNVALLDAAKGIAMFQKTNVPILGIVENMSYYLCESCGAESHIFGQDGGKRVTDKFEVPLLGRIPLMPEICAASDVGEPLTRISNHGVRELFLKIADQVVSKVCALKPKKAQGKEADL